MKPCKVCGEEFSAPNAMRENRRQICDPCRAKVDPTNLFDATRINQMKRRREADEARERMQRIAELSSA